MHNQNQITEINPFDLELEDVAQTSGVCDIINDMLRFTRRLQVKDESSYQTVCSLYKKAREWRKVIEERRKQMTEPYRREVNRINDKAKLVTVPLDEVIELANKKVIQFEIDRMLGKHKEDTSLREAAALFDDEPLYIEPAPVMRPAEGVTTITKTEKKFKLVDLEKVPTKYLTLNEDAIKQALKMGVLEIPGLEVYEETKTTLRVR